MVHVFVKLCFSFCCCYFVFIFWTTLDGAQDLVLALLPEVTFGRLRGSYGMRIKPGLVTWTAKILPTVLLLQTLNLWV